MTEAEAKLIEAIIEWRNGYRTSFVTLIDDVVREREGIARLHPYGHIAESMLVTPRKPGPYGYGDPRAFVREFRFEDVGQNRDVCDPAPRKPFSNEVPNIDSQRDVGL